MLSPRVKKTKRCELIFSISSRIAFVARAVLSVIASLAERIMKRTPRRISMRPSMTPTMRIAGTKYARNTRR